MTTCRGHCALFVVLFDADTSFELHLDADGSYDDLFHRSLEDGANICIHDRDEPFDFVVLW